MDYQSPLGFEDARIDAAAVLCADGRFGAHFDDFLRNGLGLGRCDRICLPGGPASLAGRPDGDRILTQLKFLVDAHELSRVVLVAHQACAYYTHQLGVTDPHKLEQTQHADLRLARGRVRDATGVDRVDLFFARLDGARMTFEHIEG